MKFPKLFGRSKAAALAPAPAPALRREVTVIHHHQFDSTPQTQANISTSYLTNPYAAYEALANSEDRTPILINALGPMLSGGARWLPAPVVNFQRLTLAAIADYLFNNNGLVSYGVDLIKNYSVPVIPRAATDSPDLNTEEDAYFMNWAKTADFSGRFNFWKLQELASIAVDCAGDQGFIMVGDNGFPQLQTIEGWRIGSLKSYPNLRIVDGVVLDTKGVLVGYIVQQETGDALVQASEMKLIYDAERFHAYRGMSAIRRGANDIRDHSDIKGFAKKSSKIAAALAAWISGGPLTQDAWANDTGSVDHPGTAPVSGLNPDGTTATPQDQKVSIANLLTGFIPVLPTGQTLNMLENKQPGILTNDFLTELAGFFISGLGIPPAFFSDHKLTGPNIRAVIGKAQRKFNKRSEMMTGLVEWTWVRVMADAVNKGKVSRSNQWDKVTCQGPAECIIDLGDEASNDREDVKAGQMTRQERFGKRALDWQEQIGQTDRELEYIFELAKAKADKYKVSIETALAAYGIEAAKAQQPNPLQQKPGSLPNK